MSRIVVDSIRNSSASSDGITLASDGSVTIPGNATCSGTASGFGGGKILQVVSVSKTDQFSSTSTSFVDITGLSINITPSSTNSKILVIAQITASGEDAGTGIMLDRSGTEPLKANADGSRQVFTMIGTYAGSNAEMTYGNGANHISFLDSPNTTSQLTYKLKGKTRSANPFRVNITRYTSNDTNCSLGTSTLTVMEVGA